MIRFPSSQGFRLSFSSAAAARSSSAKFKKAMPVLCVNTTSSATYGRIQLRRSGSFVRSVRLRTIILFFSRGSGWEIFERAGPPSPPPSLVKTGARARGGLRLRRGRDFPSLLKTGTRVGLLRVGLRACSKLGNPNRTRGAVWPGGLRARSELGNPSRTRGAVWGCALGVCALRGCALGGSARSGSLRSRSVRSGSVRSGGCALGGCAPGGCALGEAERSGSVCSGSCVPCGSAPGGLRASGAGAISGLPPLSPVGGGARQRPRLSERLRE
mmetsp:Transcript_33794/g.84212  ORF Transcript_33794/g.84212 Transcript_33794/m.84212 type:complete len:271 (-) Transcript_33794:1572-2384(-)